MSPVNERTFQHTMHALVAKEHGGIFVYWQTYQLRRAELQQKTLTLATTSEILSHNDSTNKHTTELDQRSKSRAAEPRSRVLSAPSI